ncbi:MAG: hypothetical protein M1833_005823 [Piccolia ochrophora]|nr:MAG: hypothetical protein M1833_005823 [Piccolia ochrophora]
MSEAEETPSAKEKRYPSRDRSATKRYAPYSIKPTKSRHPTYYPPGDSEAQSTAQSPFADDQVSSLTPTPTLNRSSSPSKTIRIRDLQYTEPSILFCSSEQFRRDFNCLPPQKVMDVQKSIRDAIGCQAVIPINVKGDLESMLLSIGANLPHPSSYQYDHFYSITEANKMLQTVIKLKAKSQELIATDEVNYADGVARKILKMICKRSEFQGQVSLWNMTTMPIQPVHICLSDWNKSPIHKRIDYVLGVQFSSDQNMVMKAAFKRLPQDERSINQTLSKTVSRWGVFMAVEVKKLYAGADPRVQLATWFAADVKKKQHHQWDLSTPGIGLEFDGDTVRAYIAFWDMKSSNLVMLGPERLGDFATEVDIFKLFHVLMAIARWGQTTFKSDLEKNVLGPLGILASKEDNEPGENS